MRRAVVTVACFVSLVGCGHQEPVPAEPEPGHTRLTAGGRVEDPAPAGDRVILASRPPTLPWRLCALAPDGPAITTLLVADSDVRCPAVSPNGSRVAWAGNARGSWDIYAAPWGTLRSEGAELIAGTDEDETSPSWAPDGRRLAWAAFDRRAAAWRIRVRGADGAARDLGEGFAPSWHPSEDRIACQRPRAGGGPWGITVVDVATGRATDVWPDAARGGITPSWSRDGRWILFAARVVSADGAESPDGIWAVTPDGSKRLRLSAAGPETFAPRETGDRRIVYCRREGDAVELWSFPSPLGR